MLAHIYQSAEVAPSEPTVSPLSAYFALFRQRTAVAAIALLLLVSGTSYASAQSLPGDPLYGMKVGVLEPIGLALRFSEESKNAYRISLLRERVEELEELAARGEADADAQEASAEATRRNVQQLEMSAVFDVRGENPDLSEAVGAYNALIDASLEIETTFEAEATGAMGTSGSDEPGEQEDLLDTSVPTPGAGSSPASATSTGVQGGSEDQDTALPQSGGTPALPGL